MEKLDILSTSARVLEIMAIPGEEKEAACHSKREEACTASHHNSIVAAMAVRIEAVRIVPFQPGRGGW